MVFRFLATNSTSFLEEFLNLEVRVWKSNKSQCFESCQQAVLVVWFDSTRRFLGVNAKQIKELKIVRWFNWLPDVDSNHGPND